MGKYNTTTVMLLDEDIRLKMQNARTLMIEDIRNAFLSTNEQCLHINTPCFLDSIGDDVCHGVQLTDNSIHFYCEYGWRALKELDYEQLHTVYEALEYEGYFKETED